MFTKHVYEHFSGVFAIDCFHRIMNMLSLLLFSIFSKKLKCNREKHSIKHF